MNHVLISFQIWKNDWDIDGYCRKKVVTKTFLEPCGKCDPCVTKSANISAIFQHLKKISWCVSNQNTNNKNIYHKFVYNYVCVFRKMGKILVRIYWGSCSVSKLNLFSALEISWKNYFRLWNWSNSSKKEVKSMSLILVSSQVLLSVVVARFFMVVSEFEDS